MKKAYLVLLTTEYLGTDSYVVVYANSEDDVYETFSQELQDLAYENYQSYAYEAEEDELEEDSYSFNVVSELDSESLEIWLDDCDGVLGNE